MAVLYHRAVCPFSRKIRLMLEEKKIAVEYVQGRPPGERTGLPPPSPTADVPVLVGDVGTVSGHYAISEWLEEKATSFPLMPEGGLCRAEVRRIVAWFDDGFYADVGRPIAREKMVRRFTDGGGAPDMAVVREALRNRDVHMSCVSLLLEDRHWLAGRDLSVADLTAAAHLSCLDYTGDVAWARRPAVRDWYARLKSRPSFRPLLADRVAGVHPPPCYTELDF